MAAIHDRILENWGADDWRPDGHRPDGVCIYSIMKDGHRIATGTLLNLDIRGKEQLSDIDRYSG